MDESLLNLIRKTAEENSKEKELEVRTLRAPRKPENAFRYTTNLTKNKRGQVWLAITNAKEIGIVRGSTKELEKAREQINTVLQNNEQELNDEEKIAASKILAAIDAKIVKNRQMREKREQTRLANYVKTINRSDVEKLKNEYQEMVRQAVEAGKPYPGNFNEINDAYEELVETYSMFEEAGVDVISVTQLEFFKDDYRKRIERIEESAYNDLTEEEIAAFENLKNKITADFVENSSKLMKAEADLKEGKITQEEYDAIRDAHSESQAQYEMIRFERPRRQYTRRQEARLRRARNSIKIINKLEENAKETPRKDLFKYDIDTIYSEKVQAISRDDIIKLHESKQISDEYFNELIALMDKEGVNYLSVNDIDVKQKQLLDELEELSIPTEADIASHNAFLERISNRFRDASRALAKAREDGADQETIDRLQDEYNKAFEDYEINKYSMPTRSFAGKGEEKDKQRWEALKANIAGFTALKGLSKEVEVRYLKQEDKNQTIERAVKAAEEEVKAVEVKVEPLAAKAPEVVVTRTISAEPEGYVIDIPKTPTPKKPNYNEKAIEEEIDALNQRTLEEYYSDKECRDVFNDVLADYLSHKVEVEDKEKGYKYNTIEDYKERKSDEEFLLLDGYRARLERLSRYKAGDNSVYPEDEEKRKALIKDDKIYISTLNHKFDKHKYTQRDLATLGKYGEKAPYIPEQKSLVGKGFRLVGNAFIGIRNFFAPVYRFIGKNVAQPLHKAITGGKGGTPFDSHPYHNFVARRDHFTSVKKGMLMLEDGEEKAKAKKEGREPRELTGLQKLRRGLALYFEPRWNALVKRKEGNEAVLRARFMDNYNNVRQKYVNIATFKSYSELRPEYEEQIKKLKQEILDHPDAKNVKEAERALAEKASLLNILNKQIAHYGAIEQTETKPVDAISEKQHAIASKEVNTFRVTVIKGVARLAFAKFVGPNIRRWLTENLTVTKPVHRDAVTGRVWTKTQDAVYENRPVTEAVMDTQRPLDGVISANAGREMDLMYSVSGGERKIQKIVLKDTDIIGAVFQEGEHGIGFADLADISPNVLTGGRTLPASLMDAAGKMRQNITVQELIDAFPAGTINPDTLDKLYVGVSRVLEDGTVSDRGWLRLGELMERVQTEKIVDYVEELVEPAKYDWVEQVVRAAEDTTETVVNTTAVNALMGTGKAAMLAGTAYDVYENLRETNTKIRPDMSFGLPRESDYRKEEAEFVVPKSKHEYEKMKAKKEKEEETK